VDPDSILSHARSLLALESRAIDETAQKLSQNYVDAIGQIDACVGSHGKLIMAGLGKNAGICQKIVGTFNSTGVSAVFLDPVQAVHGDLGVCSEGDLAFLFSNSGETREVVELVPLLTRLGLKTIAITSKPASRLAQACDLVVTYQVSEEACPLNLAPTASTTATLALMDSMAMVYLDLRGFTREDFALYHPSGTLGASLLMKVEEIMRTGDRLPTLPAEKTVREGIMTMTKAKAGCLALVHENGTLAGIFTDGDLRRCLVEDAEAFDKPLSLYMICAPKTVVLGTLAASALKVFEDNNIDDILVVDAENKPVGIIDGQDLPKLRII